MSKDVAKIQSSDTLTRVSGYASTGDLLKDIQRNIEDFRTGKFANSDKANALLRREPRKGWEFGYA